MVKGQSVSVKTKGFSDIVNITETVNRIVADSGIQNGIVTVFVVGSTASVSTIEYEPALNEDFRDTLEKIASVRMHSRHSATWGDDNGFSHIRATLMGPSLTVPFQNQRLILGTWQQIVLIDHDNRPRQRSVFVQVIGE